MSFKTFLFILFSVSFSFAQDYEEPSEPYQEEAEVEEVVEKNHLSLEEKGTLTWDILEEQEPLNEKISLRNFDTDFQSEYKGEEFDYAKTNPRESILAKIERKLSEWLASLFKTADKKDINNITLILLRIVAVVVVGLVIYWLVRYLINKEGNFFFSKKNKQLSPNANTITENIHEIDFNHLIADYEQKRDYRFAVRYQYLHLLKIFNDKKLLEWDPEKTNLDYINELSKPELKPAFRNVTHIFDYVWYGEFPVTEQEYHKYKAAYLKLKSAI